MMLKTTVCDKLVTKVDAIKVTSISGLVSTQ